MTAKAHRTKARQKLDKVKEYFYSVATQLHINRTKSLGRMNLSYDKEWTARREELWNIDRFNYIHTKNIENGKIPVFVTLTLPSKYHEFKLDKRGQYIFNEKYNGTTIDMGYKKLQEAFRSLYNNFNIRRDGRVKKQKVEFLRVIEPHGDFTPHLHAILYTDEVKAFSQHFKSIVKLHDLEQVDYELLDTANYSIAYLLKYVGKTISSKDDIILGWKHSHKIFQVRTSQLPFTKKQYLKFSAKVPFNPIYQNIMFQMDNELLVNEYVKSMEKYKYNSLCRFSASEKMNLLRVEEWECKQRGNKDNPKYVILDVHINTFNPTYIQVLEEDEYQPLMIEDFPQNDFQNTLICNPGELDTYLAEEYDPVYGIIPKTNSCCYIEDDDFEEYLYRTKKVRYSSSYLVFEWNEIN